MWHSTEENIILNYAKWESVLNEVLRMSGLLKLSSVKTIKPCITTQSADYLSKLWWSLLWTTVETHQILWSQISQTERAVTETDITLLLLSWQILLLYNYVYVICTFNWNQSFLPWGLCVWCSSDDSSEWQRWSKQWKPTTSHGSLGQTMVWIWQVF